MTDINLPALREAVAKMGTCRCYGVEGCDACADNMYAILNALPALLDELEQLREHRRLLILWAEGCAARLPVAERKALNWRDVDVARKAARQAWQAAKETP